MSVPVACTQLQHNGDVSGIGVRVSFYIQTVVLALQCLRAASHSTNITRAQDALITLSVTSMAYSTATIALGFSEHPSLNLYDAVVVVYLNLLACPVVVFLQYKNSRNPQDPQNTRRAPSKSLKIVAENGLTLAVVIQTCLFLACAMAIFGKAYTFGDASECNGIFVVSLFHPFPILPTSRRVLLGIFGALTIIYVGYYAFLVGKAIKPYFIKRLAVFHGTAAPPTPPIVRPDGKKVFDRKFFATVAALLILSMLHIVNLELLKIYNEKRTSNVDNSWSFGQILPLFLAVYSIWSAFKTFQESGFFKNPRPSPQRLGDGPDFQVDTNLEGEPDRAWSIRDNIDSEMRPYHEFARSSEIPRYSEYS